MKFRYLYILIFSLILGCAGIKPLKNSQLNGNKNVSNKPLVTTNITHKEFTITTGPKTNIIKIDLNSQLNTIQKRIKKQIAAKYPDIKNDFVLEDVNFPPIEIRIVSEGSTNFIDLEQKEIKEKPPESMFSNKFLLFWFGSWIVLGLGYFIYKRKFHLKNIKDSIDIHRKVI